MGCFSLLLRLAMFSRLPILFLRDCNFPYVSVRIGGPQFLQTLVALLIPCPQPRSSGDATDYLTCLCCVELDYQKLRTTIITAYVNVKCRKMKMDYHLTQIFWILYEQLHQRHKKHQKQTFQFTLPLNYHYPCMIQLDVSFFLITFCQKGIL